MAYKFQVGTLNTAGNLSVGTIETSDVDDGTAANIVAQIDNGEFAVTKLGIADAKIVVGNGSSQGRARSVSGDLTMDNGGAFTIVADAVESGMLHDNVISGQAELAHADIADADEMMISDGGVLKKVGVDSLRDHYFGVVSGQAAVADGGALSLTIDAIAAQTAMTGDVADTDELMINDGGALKRIDFSVFRDAVFTDVSGDATVAAGGALTISGDAVETAMIADNQVTLAKMAGLARGKLIYGDASGDPAALAAGSANRVLSSDGTDISYTQVSNDMLAGSIANGKLSNSAVTVTAGSALTGGGSVSLGGSVTLDVAVDNSSLELNSDALRVKALGVTNAMLSGSIANAKLSNSAVTIGSGSLSLGATAASLGGLQGLQFVGARRMDVAETAHDAAGSAMTIAAGATTAGTTNDIAGGALTLAAGQGKGTGAGGAIVFQVAPAAGSTASTLNALATAMTIGQDKSVTIEGDLVVQGDTVTLNTSTLAVEDKIIHIAKGAANKAASLASGLLFGHEDASNGAQLLYREDGGNRVLRARNGNNSADLDFQASNFRGALVGNADTATALASARTIGGVSFNGTGNIVPQTIQVTDESSDTSCNILFATAATGDLAPKTGTNLTFDSDAGTLTSTTFAGHLRLPVALKADTATLANGVNYIADMSADGTDTFNLPASPAVGDMVYVKAPSDASAARIARIAKQGSHTIDGATTIDLTSPHAAVMLVYVTTNTWKVF